MANPYTAPDSALTETDSDETYEPKVFSTQGRIGRLRYLAYSTGVNFLLLFVLGIVAAILLPAMAHDGNSGKGGGFLIVMALIYIPIFANIFIMAKRRLNDLDQSGWLSLLMIVPLVNFFFGLYLIFASGTKGPNNYGPMPTKNSTGVILGALVVPIGIFAIGVLAAIALPAYQSYVTRAKAAQAAQQVAPEAPDAADQGQ